MVQKRTSRIRKQIVQGFCLLLALFISRSGQAQYRWHPLDTSACLPTIQIPAYSISFRGISVSSSASAWVVGSKGVCVRILRGGKKIIWQRIPGFEKSDFRSVYAFSKRKVIIVSSGFPAHILRTQDAGKHWELVYTSQDTNVFLDAVDFQNKRFGIVLGDPIQNHFLVLQSRDGGKSWSQAKHSPEAMSGESAFAASGTCMRMKSQPGSFAFVTGGSQARLLEASVDVGIQREKRLAKPTSPDAGLFSLAFDSHESVYMVGGNYRRDQENRFGFFMCDSSGVLNFNRENVFGYRSCIERIPNSDATFIAVGTSGVDYFHNGTWTNLYTFSLNTIRAGKSSHRLVAAGSHGCIGVFMKN